MELPKVRWPNHVTHGHCVSAINSARAYHMDGVDVVTPEDVKAHGQIIADYARDYPDRDVVALDCLRASSAALRDAKRIVDEAIELIEDGKVQVEVVRDRT